MESVFYGFETLKQKIMSTEKDLNYYKANAEEDYKHVPISVLRYISELETAVKNCSIPNVSNPFNASEFEYSEFIKGKGKEYNYVSNKIHYFVNGELVKILNQ